ncbi:MAG TPA: TetR/AcrR family transcriptional regulator [Steroidobacteraceae bacterium]|nr:TetR/AcrR family transcriptional regulator [Steroidobacteraceae bacterium]
MTPQKTTTKSKIAPVTQRARRMSPTARRDQILDSAVDLIVARGLTACTLENVAKQAGISKPLIYRYFPKRPDLLKALLEREHSYVRGHGLDSLSMDTDLEQVVSNATQRVLEYLYERGPIMRLIASDRSVAALHEDRDRDERTVLIEQFTKRCVQALGLPVDIALICAVMTVNAPLLSARILKRRNIDADRVADIWTKFAMGGWLALEKEFGSAAQEKAPQKRRKS